RGICGPRPVRAMFRIRQSPAGENELPAMKRWSRRSFLAAGAAVTAAPALGAPAPRKGAPSPKQEPGALDAVIVGAGAAGIAAARRLAATGRRFALIEAAGAI